MYERFSDRARKVMQLANVEAQRLGHAYINTEHILLAIIREGSSLGFNVLRNLDANVVKIPTDIVSKVPPEPGHEQPVMGRLPHHPLAKKAVVCSVEEARKFNHNYVGSEHILLGLLQVEDGLAKKVLNDVGVNYENARQEIIHLLNIKVPDTKETAMGNDDCAQNVCDKPQQRTEFDVIGYMSGEINRLQTLLKAERDMNARLYAACSLFRECAGMGFSLLDASHKHSDALAEGCYEATIVAIQDKVDKADALLLPCANE